MSDQPNQPDESDLDPSGSVPGDAAASGADADRAAEPGAGHEAELGGADDESTGVSQEDIELLRSAAGELPDEPVAAGGELSGQDSVPDGAFDEVFGAADAGTMGAGGMSNTVSPNLPEFDGAQSAVDPKRVTMLNDVKLRVKIELGRSRMLVEDVLKLGEGSVVELDKLAGDPVDVYVNDRLVARGEVLVLNDNFCVRVSDVISNDPHRVSA